MPAVADWESAHRQPPMTAPETRAFMKRLAQFVFDNHLKKTADSPQRGMVYEYFWVARKGQPDQFVQGEALDTMHDGAWLAAALVSAWRATGDPFYKEFLTRWLLPFYCKMLNHSDTLFDAKRNDAAPDAKPWGKEWALQRGEKGFVPYWWDDGGSVSLERRGRKQPLSPWVCADLMAGQPNPDFRLSGYSHGSSNHMAQDLAVMVQQAWLMLRESPDDRALAAELAEAAKNLHQCRMNHFNHIPMCCAAMAVACGDAGEWKRLPDLSTAATWTPQNHYLRTLHDFREGERRSLPGFADDQQYRYYHGIARHDGTLPKALAFKTVYDAFTEPLAFRCYFDDAELPAGINKFDLAPLNAVNGRLEDYRSDRKGPFRQPRPLGSRMGPQNMVCTGWALQALRAFPGLWEERFKSGFSSDLRVFFDGEPARVTLGDVKLALASSRLALRIEGKCPAAGAAIKISSRTDGQGSHAILAVSKDNAKASNDKGQPLTLEARITSHESRITFSATLPYTVAKTQTAAWANGVEHGRYSIAVGDVSRDFFLASSEAAVQAALEHELAGGLRTWEAVFNRFGYIPTGIGCHTTLPGVKWDEFSDSGGYAHLIAAAAQWLLFLDGRRDWESHRVPAPSAN